MKAAHIFVLLGLLLLTAFVRGAVYSAPRTDLFGTYDGGYKPGEPVLVGEERARIQVTLDLIEGPVVPLIDYQYANYCGGSLVVSTLMIPLVHLFGPTTWTLRIFALLVNLAGLFFLFAILRRYVSLRAAVFGGVLWALASPGFLINTMVVWGTHVESNVLALATLWLFLSIHASPEKRTPKRLLLGVLQGLNLYIGYQTVLAIGMLAFFDLHPKRFPKPKQLVAHLIGFVIGFAPWLWYNLRNDFSGFNIYGTEGAENLAREGAGEKFLALFRSDLPGGQWFQKAWPVWGEAWNGLYAGILIAAALLGVFWFFRAKQSASESSTAPAVGPMAGIWLLGFLCMYTFTRFGVTPGEDVFGFRYPLIAMPWLILAGAVGLERVARLGSTGAALAVFVTVVMGGVGLTSSYALADFERFGVEREMEVQKPASHILWLFSSYRQFPERYPQLVRSLREKLSEEEFETRMRNLGQQVVWLGKDHPSGNPAQLEYAAQLRVMREKILGELSPDQQDWFPAP